MHIEQVACPPEPHGNRYFPDRHNHFISYFLHLSNLLYLSFCFDRSLFVQYDLSGICHKYLLSIELLDAKTCIIKEQ